MEKPRKHTKDERECIERREDEVTINSNESCPASDPRSFNPGVTGATEAKKNKYRPND